jgi:hypothetical protein
MIDIFDKKPLDKTNIVCHSGGAVGSDTYWENIGQEFGVKTKAYSWKTSYHQSPNKVEISESDYKEGIEEVNKANKWLNRYGIHKYMNLLARNWSQVKYSEQVIAIGTIIKPGSKGSKGFYNKSKYEVVDGGTSYAVQCAINNEKIVYVFDQIQNKWFRWSYSSLKYVECQCPKIEYQNFAGIGTREIKPNGIDAIRDVFEATFLN